MLRTINDFLDRWREESYSTIKVFQQLTDESLSQSIPKGRTLGRLANHLIESLSELPEKLGLPIKEQHANYKDVEGLIAAYENASEELGIAIVNNWTDEVLLAEKNMYGENWKNGFSLWVLITHQAHHRAQMTVLMREAELKVPGVYGPSREEWEAMHMQPME
jgi:uncharacterized damage-inducible protein DinB